MPHTASQLKPQRRSTSATKSSLGGEPLIRPQQQHSRPSSSSLLPLTSAIKSRGARAFPVYDPPNRPRPRDDSTPTRSDRSSRRETTEQIDRLPNGSQHTSRNVGTRPTDQKRPTPPPLNTRDLLRSPRLQQVTGIFPGKADLWSGRELPPHELNRLAWAMTLPEPFPTKRPRGELRTPIAHGIRKI